MEQQTKTVQMIQEYKITASMFNQTKSLPFMDDESSALGMYRVLSDANQLHAVWFGRPRIFTRWRVPGTEHATSWVQREVRVERPGRPRELRLLPE